MFLQKIQTYQYDIDDIKTAIKMAGDIVQALKAELPLQTAAPSMFAYKVEAVPV